MFDLRFCMPRRATTTLNNWKKVLRHGPVIENGLGVQKVKRTNVRGAGNTGGGKDSSHTGQKGRSGWNRSNGRSTK
jgi:hypothetical protein